MLRRADTVVQWTAESQPGTPAEARSFLRQCLDEAAWEGDVDVAVLAGSEVAGNAWRHGGGIRRLRVRLAGPWLRVEVEDPVCGVLPVPPDESTPARRGLAIVSNLADRWGVETRADCKLVWFELSAGWQAA